VTYDEAVKQATAALLDENLSPTGRMLRAQPALDSLVAEVENQWRIAQECRDNFARLSDERAKLLVEIGGLTAAKDALYAERGSLVAEVEEGNEAREFISKNRGIYGFIADDDPTRPTDEWEPYVAALRSQVERLTALCRNTTKGLQGLELHEMRKRVERLEAALRAVIDHGRTWDRSHLHEHVCYEEIAALALDAEESRS
jgi:hypothetical protein